MPHLDTEPGSPLIELSVIDEGDCATCSSTKPGTYTYPETVKGKVDFSADAELHFLDADGAEHTVGAAGVLVVISSDDPYVGTYSITFAGKETISGNLAPTKCSPPNSY